MISQVSDYKQADLKKLLNKIKKTKMSKMQLFDEYKMNNK